MWDKVRAVGGFIWAPWGLLLSSVSPSPISRFLDGNDIVLKREGRREVCRCYKYAMRGRRFSRQAFHHDLPSRIISTLARRSWSMLNCRRQGTYWAQWPRANSAHQLMLMLVLVLSGGCIMSFQVPLFFWSLTVVLHPLGAVCALFIFCSYL